MFQKIKWLTDDGPKLINHATEILIDIMAKRNVDVIFKNSRKNMYIVQKLFTRYMGIKSHVGVALDNL